MSADQRRNGWKAWGISIAAVLGAMGLLYIGFILLMFSALSSWGSNK